MITIQDQVLKEYLRVRNLSDIYEDILLMSENMRCSSMYGVVHINDAEDVLDVEFIKDMCDTYEEAYEVYKTYSDKGGFAALTQDIEIILETNED